MSRAGSSTSRLRCHNCGNVQKKKTKVSILSDDSPDALSVTRMTERLDVPTLFFIAPHTAPHWHQHLPRCTTVLDLGNASTVVVALHGALKPAKLDKFSEPETRVQEPEIDEFRLNANDPPKKLFLKEDHPV
jgi:hypothetical protein